MNLIVRYIQAVKNELPKHNRDDIAKELQSILEDELEAISEKGQFNQVQVAAFLEQRGHPVQVASQYWKRRSLVSEAVYPLYKQALVFFCSLYLALGILLNFEDFLLTRDWAHVGKLPNLFFDLLSTVAFAFFVITLVFHFFADEISAQTWFWKFKAQNLPDVSSQAAYIPRVSTISDLFSNLFGLALLTFGVVTFRNVGVTVQWSPIAGWLEVLRYLLLVTLGLNLLNLLQPYWTRAKLWISSALGVGMVLCSSMIIAMPEVVVSSSPQSLSPEGLVSLELTTKIIFWIFAAVAAWSTFDMLRRVWRLRLPML